MYLVKPSMQLPIHTVTISSVLNTAALSQSRYSYCYILWFLSKWTPEPQVINLIISFEWDVLPSAQLDCIPWEKGSFMYCKVDLTARKLTKEQSWTIRNLDNSIAWTHIATNENEEKMRQAENRSSICHPSEMSTRSKGRTVTLLFNTVQDRGQADVSDKHYCPFLLFSSCRRWLVISCTNTMSCW